MAEDYRLAALNLRDAMEGKTLRQATSAPYRHCLCHALELHMKACLLTADPKRNLRDLGHDPCEADKALADDDKDLEMRERADRTALGAVADLRRDPAASEIDLVVDASTQDYPAPSAQLRSRARSRMGGARLGQGLEPGP